MFQLGAKVGQLQKKTAKCFVKLTTEPKETNNFSYIPFISRFKFICTNTQTIKSSNFYIILTVLPECNSRQVQDPPLRSSPIYILTYSHIYYMTKNIAASSENIATLEILSQADTTKSLTFQPINKPHLHHESHKSRYDQWFIELSNEVLRFDAPVDVVLSRFFKANPKLGQKDREVLAETMYDIVRHYGAYKQWYAPKTPNWIDIAKHPYYPKGFLERSTRHALPQWIMEKLSKQGWNKEKINAFADNSLTTAPFDLRINRLHANAHQSVTESLQQWVKSLRHLDDKNVQLTTFGELAPDALRCSSKLPLQKHELFLQGKIEVQDMGSQILCELLQLKRGEMVFDFCAGAGGKTLTLAAMMRNTGKVYACDVSEKRLQKLSPRLKRSGLSNIYPLLVEKENDKRIKRLHGKMDKVLVDAPCSGLGTLRRNPDLRWRFHEESLPELNDLQYRILVSAAKLLKVGGQIVYATCSVLHQENEAIIERFLAEFPQYSLKPITDVFKQPELDTIAPYIENGMLKLLPPFTDGFFGAVLVRNAI
jgi:16S rRNA (cytosine967-C5)-methyltransferase